VLEWRKLKSIPTQVDAHQHRRAAAQGVKRVHRVDGSDMIRAQVEARDRLVRYKRLEDKLNAAASDVALTKR
jgi:hypothetical protein